MLRRVLILCLFILPIGLIGQNRKIDSLLTLVNSDKDNALKVDHLIALCKAFHKAGKPTQIVEYGDLALSIADKAGYKKGIAESSLAIGNAYNNLANYNGALDSYNKALSVYQSMNDKVNQALIYTDIGIVYRLLGNYPSALDYHYKAISIYTDEVQWGGVAKNITCIADIYYNQADTNKALEYFTKALKIFDSINDKYSAAQVTSNIADIYNRRGDYSKALAFYNQALQTNEKIGDNGNIARILSSIGRLYENQSQFDTAFMFFTRSYQLDKSIGDERGIVTNMGELGQLYYSTKRYDEAEKTLVSMLAKADSIGYIDRVKESALLLSKIYAGKEQWQKAFDYYKIYSQAKDSLFNNDKSKEIGKIEAKAIYDKKIAEQDKILARKQVELLFYAILLGVIVLISFVIFRSLRITQKQKRLIEHQKIMVETKSKEVHDSITYAKRLQDAILPPVSTFKKYLPESFLLYKPKDIVAGDFYWMEHSGDNIFIAACDCTGHGVPGAMVSVVCSNALNRAVKEFKITEPGKILDKVRELVLETFEKSEGEVKDGMDVSLCCINTLDGEFQWSGAHNPLWYIQNGEFIEVEPDKQPIGVFDNPTPFKTIHLKLMKGDCIYLFTDGYADQFGGPKGKKFKYKQLQEIIIANSTKPMFEQGEILNEIIETWKGELEQVDDILIIGIKI